MTKDVKWLDWETVGLIGQGSFGAVYEIQRDVLGDIEKAALKVISIPQDGGEIEELYNDGYDTENIISIFQSHLKSIVAEYTWMHILKDCSNVVDCDGIRYVQHDDGIGWDILVKMEQLMSLSMIQKERFSEERILRIAEDICGALKACEEHGVVHGNIKPLHGMFCYCGTLTSLDLSNFDTSSVTKMYEMFCNCFSLANLNLSSFNTSSVIDMHSMFASCNTLTSLNLANFDTSSVTNTSNMFTDCEALTGVDFSKFHKE